MCKEQANRTVFVTVAKKMARLLVESIRIDHDGSFANTSAEQKPLQCFHNYVLLYYCITVLLYYCISGYQRDSGEKTPPRLQPSPKSSTVTVIFKDHFIPKNKSRQKLGTGQLES